MRSILITGASGKIGSIITKELLRRGNTVIAISRSKNNLLKLQEEIKEWEDRFFIMNIDLCKKSASNEIKEWLENKRIFPDSLINNARCQDFLKIDKRGLISRDDFLGELTLDVVVPYELTMALSMMKNTKLLNVINIGSQYGVVAPNLNLYKKNEDISGLHYGVSKAGLMHLTKELAVRLANQNIRVNCIAYGGVEGRVDEDFKKRYSSLSPIGRMLNETDLFGPINMLLTDQSSAITGHTLVVDGGWTIW